jgi:hypothetical protein
LRLFCWVSLDVPVSLMKPWLDNARPSSDFRLTVARQLHDPDQKPLWSEASVAWLATSTDVLASYQGKLWPQMYLFRPIMAEADEVRGAVAALWRAPVQPGTGPRACAKAS